MIAVSDTSPINYLIQIGYLHILPQLYDGVIIPQAVYEELNHERAPEAVRQWISNLPGWAVIHPGEVSDRLLDLGRGEREAILLADQLKADAVLLDDYKARMIAEEKGLAVIGTLGLLKRASQQGLMDLSEAFDRLQKTTFRADPELMESMLQQATEPERAQE
jgi:predicted nucleic acid-binding protein